MTGSNGRYDGTSRFMKDQRWNFFPSFSLGWNVARENFWKPLESVVNQFKLRGSWGELGNQNTSNLYPFYEILPVKSNSGKLAGEWRKNKYGRYSFIG